MDEFHHDISVYPCIIVFDCVSPSNYPILHPAFIFPNPVLIAKLLLPDLFKIKNQTNRCHVLSENRQHSYLAYLAMATFSSIHFPENVPIHSSLWLIFHCEYALSAQGDPASAYCHWCCKERACAVSSCG